MTWFPIGSAPQDGTEFLAYDAKTGKMDVCHWVEGLGVRPVQYDGEYGPSEGEFGYDPNTVTHWGPLPPVPEGD